MADPIQSAGAVLACKLTTAVLEAHTGHHESASVLEARLAEEIALYCQRTLEAAEQCSTMAR